MWAPDIVVFHGGCDDGFGAAWVVRRRFGAALTFVPGAYGGGTRWPSQLADKNILFVDFSLKRDEMIQLANGGNTGAVPRSIVILDHHKTAEAELADWNVGGVDKAAHSKIDGLIKRAMAETGNPVVAFFDMSRSGAGLAWEMFAGEFAPNGARNPPEAPEFIRLIEDRDLWAYKYGERTRTFSAALRTYPHEFPVWDGLAKNVNALCFEGEAILRGHRVNLEKFLANTYVTMIGGDAVPVVNVPYHYASDAADLLLKRHPTAAFAASWFQVGGSRRQFSLRSENHRRDVSEVAKLYGGGGHRNAAGFQIDLLHDGATATLARGAQREEGSQ